METEDNAGRRQQPGRGVEKADPLGELLEDARMLDQECFEDFTRLRELLRAWRVGQAELLSGCLEHQLRCLQRAVLDEGSADVLLKDEKELDQDSSKSQTDRKSR